MSPAPFIAHRFLRAAWPLVAALALGVVGCKRDEGPAQLAAAKAQYVALVDLRANPDDARFDDLLAQLATIPADSSARPEADKFTGAILGARRGPPMRPLSPVAPTTRPMSAEEARMQQIQSACARLAEQLGGAQPEQRARLSDALQRCREQLERAKVSHPHPEGEGGHGPHEGHEGHAHDGRKLVGDPAASP